MNFTTGTIKRFGDLRQIVILTSGLALALGVGALSGVFEGDSTSRGTAVLQPAPSQPAPLLRTSGPPLEVLYILVNSRAEADRLTVTAAGEAVAGPDYNQGDIGVSYVAIETAEDQARFDLKVAMTASELMQQATGVRVVDLRNTAAKDSVGSSGGAVNSGAGVESTSAGQASQTVAPHIVYLVDSTNQMDAIHSEQGARALQIVESGSAPVDTFTVLDVSTAEGMRAAEHISAMMLAEDGSLAHTRIVDVR